MNVKFSLSKSIRLVVVLGGLLVAGFAGQAVLAKSDDRVPQANKPAIINASQVALSNKTAAAQKVESNLSAALARVQARLTATPEAQAADDKDMNKAGLDEDKSVPETEINDQNDNDLENNENEDAQHPVEIEFKGTLTAINGNIYTVDGMTVMISTRTEIQGAPKVGDLIKVVGTVQSDKSVQAREIKVVLDPDDKNSQSTTSTADDGSGAFINPTAGTHSGSPATVAGRDNRGSGRHGSDEPQGHD